MARSIFTVSNLANEAGVDIDEALIVLWDGGIDYVSGAASKMRRQDANRARRLLGLATRRELASRDYWQSLLNLNDDEFNDLLQRLDIPLSKYRRLTKKAIRKLRATANGQGTSWTGSSDSFRKEHTRDRSSRVPTIAAPPPLVWRTIGQERHINYLNESDVNAIHNELVEEFANKTDPIAPPTGVRDVNLLGSAISRPQTEFGGERKYPSVEMTAAALLHSLIHKHPFHNGNKRTALVSMLAFLGLNRLLVTC